jgi:sialate O-acetylesterase
MSPTRRLLLLTIAVASLAGLCALASADVRLPALFTDGLVIQQGMPAPVWGWAPDGEQVTVRLAGQVATATAQGGRWMAKLPSLKAGGPFPMTIAGKNTIELPNVYVGEVWVCSGQSNMQFSLRGAFEAQKDIDQSANPLLRLFTVPNVKADQPLDDVKSKWVEAGPATTPGFSAVAYYFGRDLQQALKVPVGLIHTSWGGSPAEVWMSRRVLEGDPEWKTMLDASPKQLANFEAALAKFQVDLPVIKEQDKVAIADAQQKAKELVDAAQGKGADEIAKAEVAGKTLVDQARAKAVQRETAPRRPWVPTELYNGMIAPLIPYAIHGAIWYQGESNAGRAFQYRRLMTDLIKNWRQDWGAGDFTFLMVQLAPFMKIQPQPRDSGWAELREAQLLATTALPQVGQAVITDVGEENDIHPKHKAPVGARLAMAARGIAYGEKIEYSGPVYSTMQVQGNSIVLSFMHVGAGLEARDGALKGFAIAGADHKFVWADAQIRGNTVVVSSPEVPDPLAVRFGWADYPVVNFWNKDGLPATPFRTDDWQMVTAPKTK